MNKLLITAAIAAAVSASPAFAADSGDTVVSANLPQSCKILSQSGDLHLGAVNAPVAGVFKYTCNFAGSPILNFISANGGVMNPASPTVKKYGIYLNDTPPSGAYASPSSWLQSSATPQAYTTISTVTPANGTASPSFLVGLTEALDVAGDYTDTLTITINP